MHRRALALPLLACFACTGGPGVSGAIGPADARTEEPVLPRTAGPHGETQPAEANPLRFTVQPGWVVVPPKSEMRRAQYLLPKVAGDPEDAELVVYYFGEQAGTVEANVERWCSQFTAPDGTDARDTLVRRRREVSTLAVEEVELHGTYVAETAPGSGERHSKPGFAMLAAIVSSDHGPYYVKLVGPEATIERWRPSFTTFVSAIRP